MQQIYNFQENLDDLNEEESIQELFLSMYHGEETTNQGTKIHRCTYPECGKIFRFKSEISRHVAIHSSNRPYQCKHKSCNKSFKRLDALENHARIHTKNTPFICSLPGCEQKFTTKAGLRYHILKHKDERSYKCTLPGCGKTFITASHLRQHQRSSVFHNKINYEEISEEKSYSGKLSPDFESSPIEQERIEENAVFQEISVETGNCNSAIEQDFEKLLNRILEENKKLQKRIELWQEHSASMQEKESTEGHCSPGELDSIVNQGQDEPLMLEFNKWRDGYSC